MEILQGLAGFNTNAVDLIGCFSKNPSPIDFFFPSLFSSTPHFKAQKRAGFHFQECFQRS